MDAPRSGEPYEGVKPPDSTPPATKPQDATATRVLSVSPNDVQPTMAGIGMQQDDVLITPRVIDQTSFDNLAASLQALIDQAGAAAGELREALKQTAEVRTQTAKASGHLQDRLRVSARMLKAFQSQIEDVRATMSDLKSHKQQTEQAATELDALLSGSEARARDAVELFEKRTAEASRSALQRYEQQITARQPALAEMDQRIDDAKDRGETLAKLVESAEVNVAVLAHKSAQATKQVEAEAVQTGRIVLECEQARTTLADDLRNATGQMGAAVEHGEAIRRTLQQSCEEIKSRAQQLNKGLVRLAKAGEKRASVEQTCQRLEELMDRLEPWEPLIRSLDVGDGDRPGHPLTDMIGELQKGLGKDAALLATRMRYIADRVETLFPPDQTRHTTRQDDADPRPPEPAPQVTADVGPSPGPVEPAPSRPAGGLR